MKMLEDEIGLPAVLRACRAMVMERRGIDTRWADLRPYFERAAKTDLGWFWRQWIESAQFPTLEIQSSQVNPSGAGFRSVVRVVQSGTPAPYRLRFALNVGETTKSVTMDRNVQVFAVQSIKKPHNFSIEILPFTLAKVLQKS
jgi:aminopeptidase N